MPESIETRPRRNINRDVFVAITDELNLAVPESPIEFNKFINKVTDHLRIPRSKTLGFLDFLSHLQVTGIVLPTNQEDLYDLISQNPILDATREEWDAFDPYAHDVGLPPDLAHSSQRDEISGLIPGPHQSEQVVLLYVVEDKKEIKSGDVLTGTGTEIGEVVTTVTHLTYVGYDLRKGEFVRRNETTHAPYIAPEGTPVISSEELSRQRSFYTDSREKGFATRGRSQKINSKFRPSLD